MKDGDYTIDQLDMGQHVNAMKAGTFDGGYTLEPSATIMHNLGYRQDRRGRRDRQIYSRRVRTPIPYAAGCAFTTDFINKRPDVAKRFAQAWAKAHRTNPRQSARRRANTSPRTR